jgi:hypothetical protein
MTQECAHLQKLNTASWRSTFDMSHPVVFVNNTIIYLVNNITYIGNNIKNSATCFGSVESSSGQIQDTVLAVHSASAYTMGSHIVYRLC